MANAFIVKPGQLGGHNPAAFQKSGVIAQAVLNMHSLKTGGEKSGAARKIARNSANPNLSLTIIVHL
ncbi:MULTISPECIES: hypothetical protein [Pseudochrobactrum]|uniref:hypothetical protein n=1 Tax=Pseudochrobactrum TaxID=354349 RepID=UPI00275B490C|nr:hypothetical protein [Pseudochrobactrum saccharolyticum]MDP8251084.1 hypothetical protein [Pseudochrobactrum saccharolyticum]